MSLNIQCFLRLNGKICHVFETKVASLASAICYLSEIFNSLLLYHMCLTLFC